jgi:hypothetical protein
MAFSEGTAWKIAENRTLRRGSSPPRAEEKIGRATLLIDFPTVFEIDSGRKICHFSGNEQEGFKALSRQGVIGRHL